MPVLDQTLNGDFNLDGKSCQHAKMGETEKVWKIVKFIISFIIPFAVISKYDFFNYNSFGESKPLILALRMITETR